MKILKFGGTALSSSLGFSSLLQRLQQLQAEQTKTAVVVSALEGITDHLLALCDKAPKGNPDYELVLQKIRVIHLQFIEHRLSANAQKAAIELLDKKLAILSNVLLGLSLVRDISQKTVDFILSFGELLSANLVTAALLPNFPNVECIDAREIIKTDDNFGNATVLQSESFALIRRRLLDNKPLAIVTGFIGSTLEGDTTTLGRGGSDYTASLIAAALDAAELELWTTVNGVMTADPKKVSRAFTIPTLTYDEALELCHFGAKVVYPLALQPMMEHKIPVRIKNAFDLAAPGSLISKEPANSGNSITGVSSIPRIALFQLFGSGLVGVSGTARRLFDALSRENVNVILISQASSETSICFAILPEDATAAQQALEAEFKLEISSSQVELESLGGGFSVVACVGSTMRHTRGLAGKLFQALGKNGINVVAIAQGSSELNISAVIESNDESKALNALHDTFFLSNQKTIHLFVVGLGLVGKALLQQILAQKEAFEARHLRFELMGIANSKLMALSSEGVLLGEWASFLQDRGEASSIDQFVEGMKAMNLPNCIFVDCTASDKVAAYYPSILGSSISVVTPNKRANSGSLESYIELRRQATKGNVKFFYETNVGAGLPVIGTLNDLLSSGDEILRIEAVLSGTLSFIFNTFRSGRSFSEVVKEAKAKGYTEPDPRDDLSGKDVARKLLILAREIGLRIEESEISVESLVPKSCEKAKTVEQFFELLEQEDVFFETKRQKAEANGEVLRFVASIASGKAAVSLQAVSQQHPFASLSGSDNVISFTTTRYSDRPLVVQGPGAGTEVTAAGVLADIVRVASYL